MTQSPCLDIAREPSTASTGFALEVTNSAYPPLRWSMAGYTASRHIGPFWSNGVPLVKVGGVMFQFMCLGAIGKGQLSSVRLSHWKGLGAHLFPGYELFPLPERSSGTLHTQYWLCFLSHQLHLPGSQLECCWAIQLPGALARPSSHMGK